MADGRPEDLTCSVFAWLLDLVEVKQLGAKNIEYNGTLVKNGVPDMKSWKMAIAQYNSEQTFARDRDTKKFFDLGNSQRKLFLMSPVSSCPTPFINLHSHIKQER